MESAITLEWAVEQKTLEQRIAEIASRNLDDKAFLKEMRALNNSMSVQSRQAEFNRARAMSVGTACGGVTDISMRMNDGRSVWMILQPVEVVELIHQLAANIGCHIHIQPRKDFSSWRNWKYTDEQLNQYRGDQSLPGVGHAPHVNDMQPHMHRAAQLPEPENQPGLQPALMTRSKSNEQTVATQKTVGRKRAKRAATPA